MNKPSWMKDRQQPQPKPIQQLAFDPGTVIRFICHDCGGLTFVKVVNAGVVPRIHPTNPTGQDVVVEIPVKYVCESCGSDRIGTPGAAGAADDHEDEEEKEPA